VNKPQQHTYSELADILLALETVLREQSLWQAEPPPAEALLSQQPFCIDTLDFNQWLQFVFIERVKVLIEAQAPLPGNSNIVAMAEECYKGADFDSSSILSVLSEFDQLIERCSAY